MTRIAITGGTGFIGTNLVSYYKARGSEVLSLDIAPPRNAADADRYRRVDILDREALGNALEAFNPDIVFHLGARTDLRGRSVGEYAANTVGVENLMAVVDRCTALRRVVVASSRLVCEIGYQPKSDTDYRPTTPYGESKVETERVVRASTTRVPWTIVRPTSIWGPWFETPYDLFFQLVGRGLFFKPSGRTIHKSFGFVGNTVHQLDRLAFTNAAIDGKTSYLCDYPPLEVTQWTEMIREAMDAPKVHSVPFGVLKLAATAGDVMNRLPFLPTPPLTSFRLNNLVAEMIYDSELVESVAGTLPYTLEQGVEQTVAWIRQNHTSAHA